MGCGIQIEALEHGLAEKDGRTAACALNLTSYGIFPKGLPIVKPSSLKY